MSSDLLRDFSVTTVDEQDALSVWGETVEKMGSTPLTKDYIPVVDDVFLSLFSGGRDPAKDPAAIMWRQIMSGRSARIRRPFHAAWAMLRRLSQVNPIIGMCVRFLLQEFRTLTWDVVPLKSDYRKTASVARMLLRFPNPNDTWTTFIDKVLIELLTMDAAPIEIWYGRYIPFNIAYERAKLNKLEKMFSQVKDKRNSPEYYEISAALTNAALRLSLLEGVQEERIRMFAQLGKETDVLQEYSLLHEQAEKLHKALLERGGTGLADSTEFHNYLAEYMAKQQPDKLDTPLDLPIALIPIPGDQIEVWGDIELGLIDFEYPYRRVLFERVVGKYRRDNMIYLREFNRADSFYGLSPVEGVLLVAYTYLIAHDVQFRYFTRSNIPAGLLIFQGPVNVDTARRRLREMLVSPERIAIFSLPPNTNTQWIQLSNVNREIQFTELINWYVKLIILSFGLQTWELGVESGSVSKRQLRIRPGISGRIKFIENSINDLIIVRAFKSDPSGIQFKFYNIDVGDFAEESNMLNNIVFKLMTLDEARVRLGLPPLKNGLSDYLFFPMGGQMFFIAKRKEVLDEKVEYDLPEKVVGMWSAIAGGMPKGLEAASGGIFPAGPALLKAKELARRPVDDATVKEIERNLSEKQRSAIKWFAKAMHTLEIFKSIEESYKFAFTVFKEMSERFGRAPSWYEWAAELGSYLVSAYNDKLAKDVYNLMMGSEDVTKEMSPPW